MAGIVHDTTFIIRTLPTVSDYYGKPSSSYAPDFPVKFHQTPRFSALGLAVANGYVLDDASTESFQLFAAALLNDVRTGTAAWTIGIKKGGEHWGEEGGKIQWHRHRHRHRHRGLLGKHGATVRGTDRADIEGWWLEKGIHLGSLTRARVYTFLRTAFTPMRVVSRVATHARDSLPFR